MALPSITYPFDTTGSSPDNLIVDEIVTLTEVNDPIYKIIIPKYSPFYLNNLKLIHVDITGIETTLTYNTDYIAVFEYVAATRSIGIPIYGGIAVLNSQYHSGTFKLTYQTLGGTWVADATYVSDVLASLVYNPRIAYWDQLTNVQEIFPPNLHTQPIQDVTNYQDLINAIALVADAIANHQMDLNDLQQHLLDFNNPHRVTKDQVELGNVANLPLATDHEVVNLLDIEKYITLRQYIQLCKRTYTLYPDKLAVPVNDTINVLVSTTYAPDNLTLFWTIKHITTLPSSFEFDQGTVLINDNTGSFNVNTLLIKTFESQRFTIQLRVNGYDGAIVAETADMFITVTETITPYDVYNSTCAFNPNKAIVESFYLLDNYI